MPLLLRSTIISALLLAAARTGFSQATNQTQSDAIRVTVAINQDGSRTVYKFQDAEHKATATTTGDDGKVREKIRYQLDDAGHFSSASIFGPDGKLRFKSRYQYDGAGRLQEERQMDTKDALLHKIVYTYNEAGKRTGFSVFGADGKLINRVAGASAVPASSPAPRKKGGQR
jgi:uncharacterized protein (DUF1684 family)